MRKSYVIKNRFYDSVLLMQIAASVKEEFGFEMASVMMGTAPNMDLMLETGALEKGDLPDAGPNDVVVAFAGGDDSFDAAYQKVQDFLESPVTAGASEERSLYSMGAALESMPGADLVFISLPGPFVRFEAQKAIGLGLNVMIFSDNVTVEDEVWLKREAHKKGLLVMGPDCGTCIIGGRALGFANAVPRGNIGIIGASGTGLQELTTLLAGAGAGITHAVGTGGRDLSQAVGGITMLDGLQGLIDDPASEYLMIISKPPAEQVADKIVALAASAGKPAVICFIGGGKIREDFGNVVFTSTIESAAGKMAALVRGETYEMREFTAPQEEIAGLACSERARYAPEQKYIRGLYSGGTLCEEALVILHDRLGKVWSNTSVYGDAVLSSGRVSREHTLVDLGDDEFTRGMPHPMIDYTVRKERLVREFRDGETALILLDVVLGYGSHADPAGELTGIIREERRRAGEEGRHVTVVAYVCGTSGDPQGYEQQKRALAEAGVILLPSNAQAARFCAMVMGGCR